MTADLVFLLEMNNRRVDADGIGDLNDRAYLNFSPLNQRPSHAVHAPLEMP